MKTINLILLVLILSLGCKEGNKSIKIITPIDGAVVEHCCFDYEWETQKSKLGFELQLSDEASFRNLLLDTILNETNFLNPSTLFPEKRYYWKVRSLSSEVEVQGEFIVRDYISEYEGSFDALVSIEDYGIGNEWDTTFVGRLTIQRTDNDAVEFYEEKTGITVVSHFNTLRTPHYENLIRYSYNFPWSNSGGCTFDTAVDSIYARRCNCGLGGGRRYSFKAKKE